MFFFFPIRTQRLFVYVVEVFTPILNFPPILLRAKQAWEADASRTPQSRNEGVQGQAHENNHQTVGRRGEDAQGFLTPMLYPARGRVTLLLEV